MSQEIGVVAEVKGRRPSFVGVAHLSEGELYPAVVAIGLGRLSMDVPIGAWVAEDGKVTYKHSIDVVGLVAVIGGLLVGWRASVAAVRLAEHAVSVGRQRPKG